MDRRKLIGGLAGVTGLSAFGFARAAKDVDAQAAIDEGYDAYEDVANLIFERVKQMAGSSVDCESCRDDSVPINADEALLSETTNHKFTFPAADEKFRSALSKITKENRYWALPPSERPTATPDARDVLPDYAHLKKFGQPQNDLFKVSAETMSFLARRNRFKFRDLRSVRVIGLRGCQIPGTPFDTGWGATQELRLVETDYQRRRCVIGLWRPRNGDWAQGDLRFFSASTVPEVSYMLMATKADGVGCSLLPTGLYPYRARTHNGTMPGALCIDLDRYVVLRAVRKLSYNVNEPTSLWTLGNAHNIHAGNNGTEANWSVGAPVHNSAGCQVVKGLYAPWKSAPAAPPVGEWRTFMTEAGTYAPDRRQYAETEQAGKGTFDYMLLTGLEAALAHHTPRKMERDYHYLRFGSIGGEVEEACEKLEREVGDILGGAPIRISETFNNNASFATLKWHKLRHPKKEYLTTIWPLKT